MNQLDIVKEEIQTLLPQALISVDAPIASTGIWLLDVVLNKRTVVVEWSSSHGFGISSREDIGYGEGPDELILDPKQTAQRVFEILKSNRDTRAP